MQASRSRFRFGRGVALALAALFVTGALAEAAPPLLTPTRAALRGPAPSPAALGTVVVEADLGVVTAVPGGAPELELTTPDGGAFVARRTHYEARGGTDFTWDGEVVGGGSVTLASHAGWLAGRVQLGERIFELSPAAGGQQVLMEVDPARFGGCASEDGAAVPVPSAALAAPAASGEPGASATTVLDVLALYTPQAASGVGGVLQLESVVQAAVAIANSAFRKSEVDVELNLLAIEPADHDDAGALGRDLAWVAFDPEVAALRDAYAADMVGLIVEGTDPGQGGQCGQAYTMRDPGPQAESLAFQVTSRYCAVSQLIYAHEHGHNLGLEHDPANAGVPPESASFPWSFGHVFSLSSRTVMATYEGCLSPCVAVDHWSNPDVRVLGKATGIAGTRDNARTLRETALIVRDFRTPPCADADGDGYGDPASSSCASPEADCDDGDPAVNPGAAEIPSNGIDDDCNPLTPIGCTHQR